MKTNRTHYLLSFLIVAALSLPIATTASAQDLLNVELAETVVVTAEVVAIDREDRVLTLLGPENIVDIHVSDAARNFDQVRVGDQVTIEYHQSVALYLGEPGTQPEEDAGLVMGRSAKGESPAGYAIGVIDVSASVVGIDKTERALTLDLPDGSATTIWVDESIKAFDTLKVGDTIHARLTKAIAISVETPER